MFTESKRFPLKAFQGYIQQPCNYVNLSGTVRSQDQWSNRSQVQTWPEPVNFSQRAASSVAQELLLGCPCPVWLLCSHEDGVHKIQTPLPRNPPALDGR